MIITIKDINNEERIINLNQILYTKEIWHEEGRESKYNIVFNTYYVNWNIFSRRKIITIDKNQFEKIKKIIQ